MGCVASSGAARPATFDDAVAAARRRCAAAAAAPGTASHSPFAGYRADFDVRYVDRDRTHAGYARLRLSRARHGGGYEVRGECGDVDGAAAIEEGGAAPTGDAWWVERIVGGEDAGLRTLTEGRFDFGKHAFAGTWRASNGLRGHYTRFAGSNASTAADPYRGDPAETTATATALGPTASLRAMLEDDIPVVAATPW